ncbi:hypothetical protein AAC387_Pa01g0103 [Persea americana]
MELNYAGKHGAWGADIDSVAAVRRAEIGSKALLLVEDLKVTVWPAADERGVVKEGEIARVVKNLKVSVRPAADERGVAKGGGIARVVKNLMDGADEGKRIKTRTMGLKEVPF